MSAEILKTMKAKELGLSAYIFEDCGKNGILF